MTKRNPMIAVPLLALAVAVALAASRGQVSASHDDDDDGDNRWRIGLRIAPVPLNLMGKNRREVGLGSYFVNGAGDCNGCHTVGFEPYLPGGNPFLGEPEQIDPDKYLVGGSEFGPFVSRNLRPDPVTGRPAELTFRQFRRVMRTGVDLKNIPPADLLQVMPWPNFSNLTDDDLRAIYEYLRALPPKP